jgi:hypothetical protein
MLASRHRDHHHLMILLVPPLLRKQPIRHRDGGRPTKYDRMPLIGRSTLARRSNPGVGKTL